jgi:hypothetical protein
MTREKFLTLWPNATASTLKANGFDPLDTMATTKRKRSPDAALDKKPRRVKSGSVRVVVRCSIIACRHRILDSDNAIAGAKPLRDGIAKMFGLDDADARIEFEYGQCQTNGEQGTIVKIERIEL